MLDRTSQLETLAQASLSINTTLEIPVVMRNLVALAMKLVGATSGTAGKYQDRTMVFTEYNEQGTLVPIHYRFAPGYGVPGWVMTTRRPYLANDAANDPHVVPSIQQALGFRNLADVPIISRSGELLGCFELHNKEGGAPFTEADVSLLEALAAAAAVALENARLLAQVRDAEEAARRDRDFVSHVIETNPVGILSLDREGVIRFANAQAERVLGMGRGEACGRSYDAEEWHIATPDGDPVHTEQLPFRRVMEARQPVYDVRHSIERQGGQRVLLSVNAAPVFNAAGEFDGMVASLEDITERVRAEGKLRESERRLRSVIEGAPFGAHEYELRPGGRLVFTGYNEAANEILGVDCAAFLGKTIEEAFPPLADTPVPDAYRAVAATGTVYEDEQVSYSYGEITGAYEISAFQTGQNRMAVFFRDVTERRRAQERVRQAEDEKKRFYREVVLAVTHGKLHLVDADEIPSEGEKLFTLALADADAHRAMRTSVRETAEDAGIRPDAAADLALVVGEAATNAVKHAGTGQCTLYRTADAVIARVTDQGPGISSEHLAGALFGRGFSTTVSLGMGYTLMLELADDIWLATGSGGTTVQLAKWIRPEEHLEALRPMAWAKL